MATNPTASRRTLLTTAAAAVAVPANTLAAIPHPDAELLRLGRELEAAWAHEKAVYAGDGTEEIKEAALEASQRIVEMIGRTQAHTMDGLRIKAEAVRWCRNDGEIGPGFMATTDEQLAYAIVRDLLTA